MSQKNQDMEKAARKMRHANAANRDDQAFSAQQELQQPEHAKARPPRSQNSNAGEDGGA